MLSEQMTDEQVKDAMALREVFKLKPEAKDAFGRLLRRMNDDAVTAYLAPKANVEKSWLTGYRTALDELLSSIEGTIRDGEKAVEEERAIASEFRSQTLGFSSDDMAL